ncbi:hypothetical protein DERP_014560 [Dermatophagoides pteronyssinus]|uniref:Uncharacterized protein n=1 Tax=Dermatophagoides pteronyssinus TaxID=6956 RepID=A0ABQ8IPY4_DERPT|nr:hypothetical protein DERP_014560 [Dermatophagoides pteronyssinus]
MLTWEFELDRQMASDDQTKNQQRIKHQASTIKKNRVANKKEKERKDAAAAAENNCFSQC